MNRPETLKRTLDSYVRGNCIPGQIVVVDQSHAGLKDTVRAIVDIYSETNIDYIYQETASSTMARNKALNYAKYEDILFSDDDIEIYNDTLENLYQVMLNDNIAMVAGIDDCSNGVSSRVGYFLGTRSFAKRKIGHVTKSMLGRYPDRIYGEIDTEWAMGYFFAVRESLIEKWKIGWDEKLRSYAYAEDLDFSYSYYKKAVKENMKCVLNETVRVKHMVSKEYRTPSQKSTDMYVQHRRYLAKKHAQRGATGAILWCDLWKLAERFIKHEDPDAMLKALKAAWKNRKSIEDGEFDY